MTQRDDTLRLSSRDWIVFISVIFGHAFVVFGALLFWANRVVSLEVRMNNIETTISSAVPELRADVKEILKRTPHQNP